MSERDLIEELQAISEDRHGAKNTHLLSWLEKGYFHCQHGSEEWCQGDYLDSARAYIERLEAVSKASLATIARLSEALAEAEKKGAEVERLAEFARSIIRDSAWQGCDLDGADVQERALKAGLLRREVFDPAVHEDVEGYTEPGMDWFVFSGPLDPPRDLSQGGQHG